MSHLNYDANPAPSLARHFASIFYDLIALLAIWFFAALIIVIVRKGETIDPGNPLFTLYLLLVSYAYFGFCWTRGGQTLGMKAWKIILVGTDDSGTSISWKGAAIRFIAALVSWAGLGLGFLWAIFAPQRRTWHDRLSASCLRHVAGSPSA